MGATTTDFINVGVFVKAIAKELQDSLGRGASSKRILTLDEAAEYCGLSAGSFKKKVARDRIRRVRLDKRWRFDIADLDAWIESHKDELVQETAA